MTSVTVNKRLLFIDKLLSYHIVSATFFVDNFYETSLQYINTDGDDACVNNIVITFNNGKKTFNYCINSKFCEYIYNEEKYEIYTTVIEPNTTDASFHFEDIFNTHSFERLLNMYFSGPLQITVKYLRRK